MKVTKLDLSSNGLSGVISGCRIDQLSSLETLILRDNDIKGEIPSEIVNLANLSELDLSYNSFRGNITNIFNEDTTQKFTKLRLQANRLEGSITGLRKPEGTTEDVISLLVSDCGFPFERSAPIRCENCTMCCNSFGECEATYNQHITWQPLTTVITDFNSRFWTIISMLFCGCVALSLGSLCVFQNKDGAIESDNRIFTWIGEASVYKYFLTDSKETYMGWVASTLVAIAQLLVLLIFYREAELDFEREDFYNQAWTYEWQCPPDDEECKNIKPLTVLGWIVFAIMMVLNLGVDILNGCKLLITAPRIKSLRFQSFIGGSVLVIISVMGIYTSLAFNNANAESSTELIINSAVLLFVNNLDELCLLLIQAMFPRWYEAMENHIKTVGKGPSRLSNVVLSENELHDEIMNLKRENEETKKKIALSKALETNDANLQSKMSEAKKDDLGNENRFYSYKGEDDYNKIGKTTVMVTELQAKILFLERENRAMKRDFGRSKVDNEVLKSEIEVLKRESESLKADNRDLKSEIRRVSGEISSLRRLIESNSTYFV